MLNLDLYIMIISIKTAKYILDIEPARNKIKTFLMGHLSF